MKITTPGPTDHISLADAIEFVAERVRIRGEPLRATRDKVRKRVTYAIATGALREPDSSGFLFGEFASWAMGKRGWQALNGLPAFNVGGAHLVFPAIIGTGQGKSLPDSLDACRAALVAADARIAELECRNAVLEAEVSRLQPFEIQRKKMRDGGKRGGRGNSL
jgi:hypothetical protein